MLGFMTVTIRPDDLTSPAVRDFLTEHQREMRQTSPFSFALDVDGLRRPEITVFTVWDNDALVGTAALKRHDEDVAEIKSMRIAPEARGRKLSRVMLSYLVEHARADGHTVLRLETGTEEYFVPARAAYARFGFTECGSFAHYADSPNSTFMELQL